MNCKMNFRKATAADLDEVAALYDALCDSLEQSGNPPGWKKGIYPTRQTAAEGIAEGAMYLLCGGGRVAGSVILRSVPEAGYAGVDWGCDMEWEEVYVIYTLCLHPDFLGKGCGAAIMEQAEALAVKHGKRALRLDVYEGNAPAIALYKKCGYELVARADLGYSQYGLDMYELYQKLISKNP